MFFFEKKEPTKVFLVDKRGRFRIGPRTPTGKSFLLLFFKKEVLPFCFLAAAVALLFATAPTGGDFANSDAPRHAMDGLFIRDLLLAHPTHGLKRWAIAYYLRHPALAILLYPPFFAAIEAAFFLVFGASHDSAQAVVACFTFLLAVAAYGLARAWLPRLAALGCALLVIGVPAAALWERQVMLDIPAFALTAAAASALVFGLAQARPASTRLLFAAVLLLLAACYTKYTAMFVAPAFAAAYLRVRPPQFWRDRSVMIIVLFAAAGALPAVALLRAFGSINLQSVSGIAADAGPAAWFYYLRALPEQLGWWPLLLGLAGLRLLARASLRARDPAATLLLVWLVCAYMAFSAIALKNPRFDIALILPLCMSAMVALHQALPRGAGEYACLALGAGVLLHSVVFGHVPRVNGYAEIARFIGNAAPANAVIVYSGYRDGNLVFDLMTLAHRPDIAVIRADKLLLSVPVGERATRGVRERTRNSAALLRDIAPDMVVMQPGFWNDLHAMASFEHAVGATPYREAARFPTTGDLSTQDGGSGVVVYTRMGPAAPRRAPVSLDMPDIDEQFVFKPKP
jgi:hypothetical protein